METSENIGFNNTDNSMVCEICSASPDRLCEVSSEWLVNYNSVFPGYTQRPTHILCIDCSTKHTNLDEKPVEYIEFRNSGLYCNHCEEKPEIIYNYPNHIKGGHSLFLCQKCKNKYQNNKPDEKPTVISPGEINTKGGNAGVARKIAGISEIEFEGTMKSYLEIKLGSKIEVNYGGQNLIAIIVEAKLLGPGFFEYTLSNTRFKGVIF